RNVIDAESLALGLEEFRAGFVPLARRFQMEFSVRDSSRPKRVALLVSKEEHCLVDLLHRWRTGELSFELPCVLSNHERCREYCDALGVPFRHIPFSPETKAESFEAAVSLLEQEQVELVVLARFMQILPAWVCERFAGRILNIHHSFLPSFAGSRPYRQAFERGVKLIGATSHFVTAELDAGPIIEQDVMRVDHSHSLADLVRLGRDVEKTVLARALRAVLEERVLIDGNKCIVFR
ncbi:MAG: formyltetrahydrofolate deformylase, partial [Myxococcota bacterium]|nr:formyltetrahydrofolate deformylase [Myxococcota bacterium]